MAKSNFKIGFFFQNNKKGGLDTFIVHLLNNWPYSDRLLLYCNKSHPGFEFLRESLADQIEIRPYEFLIFQDLPFHLEKWPRKLRFFLKLLFWAFGSFYQGAVIRRNFNADNLDRLLVVNGGYPGGDACLSAAIVWNKLRKERKAWLNFHNFVVPEHPSFLRRLKERWVDQIVSDSVEGFISVSQSCLESLCRRNVFKVNKNYCIYNGIEPLNPLISRSVFDELRLPESTQIILMLGVYESRKGHQLLFHVMEKVIERCPSAHLLVCGYGSSEEVNNVDEMRKNSLANEHIHLQGHRNDIANLLAQSNLLVVPSQDYESFGYTAVEALSCSVPVVVTNVGGLCEVVEDKVCGFVVPKDDVVEFAERILYLLLNPEIAKKMGRIGRQRCLDKFGAERMAREYAELIRI